MTDDMMEQAVRNAMKDEGVSLYIIVKDSKVVMSFYAFSDETALKVAEDRPLYKRVEKD